VNQSFKVRQAARRGQHNLLRRRLRAQIQARGGQRSPRWYGKLLSAIGSLRPPGESAIGHASRERYGR